MSSDFYSEPQDHFKGVWIPKEIYLHPDLSWTEKILLSKIDSLDNGERGCFASNKWLASFLNLKDPTHISSLISRLESLKFITVKINKYVKSDPSLDLKKIKTERLIFFNFDKFKTKHEKSAIPETENIWSDIFISKRRFEGVWIPKEIYLHPDLSWTEKILWTEVYFRGGNNKNGCYATNEYFAAFLKLKIRTIGEMITNLKKIGFLFCLSGEDGKGNIRILRCNTSLPHKNPRGVPGFTTPLKPKGVPHKNPSIRIDIKNRYSKEYLEEQAKACWKGIVGGADAPASNPCSVIIPSFSRKRKPNLKKRYPLMRGTFGYKFVRKWNEEGPGNTTQHNLVAKTKTLIQIKRYLNQLKAGRFFRDKEIDPGNNDQVKKGFERWKRECHKFSEQELLEGIENLHKLFTHGYWPDNKNILPRGLNTLLYNERTNKSWFLNVLAAAPRPNGQKNIKFAETYSVPNAELMEVLGLNRETIGAKIKDIDKAVCHIFDTYQKTVENNPSSFGLDDFQNEYQTPGQFLGGFIEWIRNQDWLDSIELRMFLPGSRVFQLWKESLEGDFKGYGDQIFKVIS